MSTRREFLVRSATAAGGMLLGRGALAEAATSLTMRTASKSLDILVLGGTGFIGPHLVRFAVSRGHRLTIFTRGRHNAELPDGVTRLVGDRNGQLGALEGKRWDVAIDDSATNPDWVRQSAELLSNAVGRYLYTSSTGVYYPYLKRGLDESVVPHVELTDANDASERFGVAKARCEREVRRVFGDRALVVRPTYIVGPGDTTDRFPYWPQRLARGGETLAPGRTDDPAQFIDVRDLAEWMVRLLEDGQGGAFNAVGPLETITMPRFLEQAKAALGSSSTFTQVDDYAFLTAHEIDEAIPWALLKGNDDGMMSISNQKAIGAGLTFRPLAATVRDTLAWWQTVPEQRRAAPHFTISPEKEAEALADWHARGR